MASMHKAGAGKRRISVAWCLGLALSWFAIVPARAQGLPASAPDTESSAPPSPPPEAATAGTSGEPTAEQLAEARRLFARGVEHAREHSYARAASKFEEALAIHRASAIEYNLASALYELARFDESYAAVTRVLAAVDVSPEVRARAEQLELTLQEKTARLTVLIGENAARVEVRVDGAPWTRAQLGVTHAVAPGRHMVEATCSGHLLSTREVPIPLRTAALVDLTLMPCADPSSLAEPGVQRTSKDGRGERSRAGQLLRNRWLWGGVAAVLVAGGVTAAILLARDHGQTPKSSASMTQAALLTWR